MRQENMHLINKLFQNENIRTVWDKAEEKYYISVIDVVGILSESDRPRKCWNKLKQRLKEEGNETVTNCYQLKLQAQDGKYRLTDLSEEATKRLAAKKKPKGLEENIKLAHIGGSVAVLARNSLENNLEETIVTYTNNLNYKYKEEQKSIKN